MKFYAADNAYGTATSIGFENTWEVIVFSSRAARDEYVENGNLSTRAIRKKDIPKYIAAPKPFSGKSRMIDTYWPSVNEPSGLIGRVVRVYHEESFGYLPL